MHWLVKKVYFKAVKKSHISSDPLALFFICLFLEWLQKSFSPLLFISAFDTHIYIMYTWKVCCGRYCVTSWYRTFSISKHRRRFDFKLGLVEPTFNWVCSMFGLSSLPERFSFFFALFFSEGLAYQPSFYLKTRSSFFVPAFNQ